MSILKPRHGLLAGLAIILLANAVALAGVWQNRTGEPESRLLLSGRELQRDHEWSRKENSGLTLRLDWRRPSKADGDDRYLRQPLDEAQLLALGFRAPDKGKPRPQRNNRRREALVVLELDGPAYQAEMERESQRRERARRALAAEPGDKHLQDADRAAQQALEREKTQQSRLFAVDVGLDRQALRQRYPDRERYAIVPGTVQAWLHEGQLQGQLSQLRISTINVPYAWRHPLGERLASEKAQFLVQVSFGQRLEPWVSAAPDLER
ncbi:DUF4824 family protein [Pseudomonas boanensis]|uniref:DUF4824 family protein n=1 Tax=Metapseudomonas boanensis TaxID=2822138 RepID=UPI0035D4A6B8